MNVNIFEFAQNIINVCASKIFIKELETLVLDDPVAKLRASIDKETFIDIYYNSETGKCSFTLIKNEIRTFGIDNTRHWHIHPFENPETHVPCDSVPFEKFIELIERGAIQKSKTD